MLRHRCLALRGLSVAGVHFRQDIPAFAILRQLQKRARFVIAELKSASALARRLFKREIIRCGPNSPQLWLTCIARKWLESHIQEGQSCEIGAI